MADPAVQAYLSQMQADGEHDEASESAAFKDPVPGHDTDGEIDLS